jgi:arabinofuranosyltransferase
MLFAATVFGACQLWFMCDDAFITFRYVANAHAGHGLVWNPPPFAPVEGYTCFSWALLLWAAWAWFGVEPPDSANWLSLALGVAQLAIVAAAALRLRDRDGRRLPDALGLVAIAVVVGNRTFLQWLTSGLETALFNVGFVGWVLVAFRRDTSSGRWLATWSAFAVLAALTRPDGLLLVAATVAAAAWCRLRAWLGTGALLRGLLPLLAVVVHVAWRRNFYGEWLPNTYYAKITAPWPEAGWRYLATFVVEHGAWFPALLAVVWLVAELRRRPRFLLQALNEHTAATAAVAATLAHAGYYVWRVGGDHFEYRVFSQLVPLLVLATAAMSTRIATRPGLAVAATLAFGGFAGAGWVHLWATRDMPPHGFRPIAPQLPAIVQPVARWFDRQQAWLLFHNVGLRCSHHAQLLVKFMAPYPTRLRITDPPDPFPVFATGAVGVVGWALPDCAILDQHGLNDRVVARTPVFGDGPALTRDFLRPVITAADTRKDGWLDSDEIRTALSLLGGGGRGGGARTGEAGDYLVAVLLAIHSRERADALTLEEAEGISDLLLRARSMAHERHPPPGYVEAFAPNVTIADGVATAQPRAEPLTAERVRALEAEWWQRTLAAARR